ncbi:unnamed protein product [Ceutorhynchus assimilis]|uniref:Luciferin 4-monooxygenase-like n=1 Tax=Ceutorhynchus assimilis TaxID=467358 RepID=A0A9P0DGW9_9CUCU|nr:unnamed protein product [Ceutorhynchus assimilis]
MYVEILYRNAKMMSYENGIIKTNDIPYNQNSGGIGYMFYTALKEYGDRVALINSKNDEFRTNKDLLERCTSTAVALQKRGFKQQDLVAVCSNRENLDANVPLIAGQFLGCVTFSLDPNLTVKELCELVNQIQPKIIFLIDEAKNKMQEALKICDVEVEMVTFGKEFESEFLKFDKIQDFEPVFIENLKETCMIHFSSGSTSCPKPICLNHYYFMTFAVSLPNPKAEPCQAKFENHEVGNISLKFMNWYWISASLEMFHLIWTGNCRLLKDEFDVDQIWDMVAKYKISDIYLKPVDIIAIIDSKPNVDISSLKTIYSGGSPFHKDYIEKLKANFPDIEVLLTIYAMTECGVITYPYKKEFLNSKPVSCGLPWYGLHYKVVDVETGKICGFNQPGELYVKGKRIFNGIYNQDSSESFDDEGYFKTGDLVYYDEDFCFFVVDRLKAVLKWNNIVIYPSRIEKVLLSHPAVSEAIVIGIPHKTEIERLLAAVILKDNVKVIEDDLVKFVAERVEDCERLRGGVVFVKYFPVTITGKVSRLKVKEMILDKLNK